MTRSAILRDQRDVGGNARAVGARRSRCRPGGWLARQRRRRRTAGRLWVRPWRAPGTSVEYPGKPRATPFRRDRCMQSRAGVGRARRGAPARRCGGGLEHERHSQPRSDPAQGGLCRGRPVALAAGRDAVAAARRQRRRRGLDRARAGRAAAGARRGAGGDAGGGARPALGRAVRGQGQYRRRRAADHGRLPRLRLHAASGRRR